MLERGLDSADEAEIRPFRAALLDYDTVEAWGETQIHEAISAGTLFSCGRPGASR